MDNSQNPLLALDPSLPLPFDRVTGAHVEPAIATLLDGARERIRAIAASAPRTYASTLGALDEATRDLDTAMTVVAHLELVATTPELRAAHAKVKPEVSAFQAGIPLDRGVWSALTDLAASDEGRALLGVQRRFLDKTLADFRRVGAGLEGPDKERLLAIDAELASLTLKFGQNVLDATNAFEIIVADRAALAGLPERCVEAARESAAEKGAEGYRLTLQAPSYVPAMTYLDDGALRERLYRAFNTRAASGDCDNRALLRAILALRRKKAKLLGFAHFAGFVLEDRMAKTGEAARSFVRMLHDRTEPFFARENEELTAFRRALEGPGAPPLEPWDIGYYADKLRRARYDFDEEALRPYFPLDAVLRGAFTIVERLYGVTIEPWDGGGAWDPSVTSYLVREPGGEVSARFYVDVTPRDNKRDGAWMYGLVTAVPGGGAPYPHVEVLAGNVTPPVGGKPALLGHREVETIFHELGHLMHHAASRVPIASLAGTSVAWDFVELPSQIMENWCWDRGALDLFARHYETGERIPDALFERMRAARTFRTANAMMRQLGFAEVDLALHMDLDPESDADPIAFAREVLARHAPAAPPSDYAMVASFSHLFASPVGYAAGYYSYKWAEVLDADAFSRFKREGLLSREVGQAFRDTILARGDSEDPSVLFERFMGRPPRLDALFERDGLIEGAKGS